MQINKANFLLCSQDAKRLDRDSFCEVTRKGPAERGRRPGGKECPSSRWIQIAMQNCSAGEPGQGDGEPCFTRPLDEHTIWRSEMNLKGGRGGHGRVSAVEPDMSMEAKQKLKEQKN